MIRPAKFEDIKRVVELLQLLHSRSIYASLGTVSAPAARALVEEMGARMEAKGEARTLFMVATNKGVVQGFLIAVLQPVYHIADRIEGTDVFTVMNEGGADPSDFVKLIVEFKRWCLVRGCLQVRAGISDIMGGEWRRLVPVYEQLGFKQSGAMLTWRCA